MYAPFEALLGAYRRHWSDMVEQSPIPLSPLPVSGGWDSRPWHGENNLIRFGRTPDLVQAAPARCPDVPGSKGAQGRRRKVGAHRGLERMGRGLLHRAAPGIRLRLPRRHPRRLHGQPRGPSGRHSRRCAAWSLRRAGTAAHTHRLGLCRRSARLDGHDGAGRGRGSPRAASRRSRRATTRPSPVHRSRCGRGEFRVGGDPAEAPAGRRPALSGHRPALLANQAAVRERSDQPAFRRPGQTASGTTIVVPVASNRRWRGIDHTTAL